jgi:hypothetical protein
MEVIRLSAWCTSHPYCLYIFLLEADQPCGPSMPGRIMSKNFSVAPLEIECESFRLVEQCLNQMCQLVPQTNSLTLKVKKHSLKQATYTSYCLLRQMSVKCGMGILQCTNAYSGESDSARMVCVIGRWVALIFSMPYYIYHRCMCINILHR